MSNDIAITSQPGATVGTAAAIFSPEGMDRLVRFATLMADSKATVPAHLAGKPADCLAVTMQAAQWGMNPFAVAQKTHVVNGTLGYEAQLVNAAITAMAPTKDRVHFEWFGPWENVIGKFIEKTNDKGKKYLAAGWSATDEKGCGVKVWATLKGESEPRVLDLLLTQAQVRNSTLWGSDPKQQLAYLGVKRWARLYCPDVILGVYTPDELQETAPRVERDITPPARNAAGMNSLINAKPDQQPEERTRKSDDRDPDEMLTAFTDAAMNYNTIADLDKAYKYVAKNLANDDERLSKATDVYTIRRDELNEIPM
ncbi:RecT family recombinase [Klebsiella pneumoniae]|uniref:RecT family recombinase n=1 Tax=Klebsiella pneumoniae TaxID=573 RepID=UPI001CF616B8|nr:RecT family recombinase [Klebsiella pneumoniae]MCB4109780.1 recombinase RecT [Klebsiella pneumoniae]MCB4123605.1 recombinase RecT [Klebsiella pneumoniae]MCM2146988.1 recombinase RecT [Klebsiella pneumoniae]MCM2226898.1 recombinase RecT [Klebsiella pneumoniae]MDS7709556.1 recombinase RecT [Klebsiella pneumoniae]